MRTKRLIIFCLILLFLPKMGQASLLLGLDTTREKAVKGNQDYLLAKIELEIAELQLTQAHADNLIDASPVLVCQAENMLVTAQLHLASIAKQVLIEIDSIYYAILRLEQQISIAEQSVALANKQLLITEAKLNEGLATPANLSQAHQSLLIATNQLSNFKEQFQLNKLEFLHVLNLPCQTDFQLDKKELSFETLSYNSEDLFEQLLQNNNDIIQVRTRLSIAELEESAAEFNTPLIQQLYALAKQKLEIQYDQTIRNVYIQALKLWNNLKTLENMYDVALGNLTIARENKEVMELRYTDGLELETNLVNAEIEVSKAEQEVITILFEYNIAKSQFLNFLGE